MADEEALEEDDERGGAAAMSAERLAAFSDGVLAVIITITALEIRAPAGASFSALRHRFPLLAVYVLSFAFVGIYWNNHHHLVRAVRRIDGTVMWANLHLLLWLSLIPVTTEWVGSEYRHSWPAFTYSVVAFMAGVAYVILQFALIRANPIDAGLRGAIGPDYKGKISLAAYTGAAAASFVSPYISYGLFVAVAAMWFVPDRRLGA